MKSVLSSPYATHRPAACAALDKKAAAHRARKAVRIQYFTCAPLVAVLCNLPVGLKQPKASTQPGAAYLAKVIFAKRAAGLERVVLAGK